MTNQDKLVLAEKYIKKVFPDLNKEGVKKIIDDLVILQKEQIKNKE